MFQKTRLEATGAPVARRLVWAACLRRAFFASCAWALMLVAPMADVFRAVLEGPVTPVQSRFVASAIDEASAAKAELFLLVLDTPGGMVGAMEEITSKILNSPVPVAVYVGPSGAHAASAGFFILQSADVAAMAQGTRTGAAHPVQLLFGGVVPVPDDQNTRKILEKSKNDLLALLRDMAANRGRNVAAALAAVEENASYTAGEAKEKGLVDLLARDERELMEALDGRQVKLFNQSQVVLRVKGKAVRRVTMSVRERLMAVLADPNLAVILGLFGILGLFVEFTHPGFVVPGVVGGICLILALYGFSMLPVSLTGIALLVLALGLFAAEIKAQGFGILGGGGIASLLLGLFMLMDTPDPGMRIRPAIILGIALPVGVTILLLSRLVVGAMRRPPVSGREGMVGQRGVVGTPIDPVGTVFVRGEIWSARSEPPARLGEGAEVEIARLDGLLLIVRPAPARNQNQGGTS